MSAVDDIALNNIINKHSTTVRMLGEGVAANATLLDESKEKMAVPRRKLSKVLKVGGLFCVLVLILIVVTALATGRKVSDVLNYKMKLPQTSGVKNVAVSENDKTLTFSDDFKGEYLVMEFPHKVVKTDLSPTAPCREIYSEAEKEKEDPELRASLDNSVQMCLQLEDDISAAIHETDLEGLSCHTVQWYSKNKNAEIVNCFNLVHTDRWYGGGGLSIHRWPLNRANIPLQPHTVQKLKPDSHEKQAVFDSFIEPYFVSARGAAILLEPYLPLFISVTDEKICFKSSFQKPYYPVTGNDSVLLKYIICKDTSAKTVHRDLLKNSKINHPHQPPSFDILRKPLWSTRGFDVNSVNEMEVLDFVRKMKDSKLLFHQLFIDGNYSRSLGSLHFNPEKFPHSLQLIMELMHDPSSENLYVGTEVYPYILNSVTDNNIRAQAKDKATKMSDLSYLDFTNETVVSGFKSQLKDFSKDLNIKGFLFSGGFVTDDKSMLKAPKSLGNPNLFTAKYAELASDFGDKSIMGSGYQSQQYTFIADAGPMVQSAGHNKGLKSIIPTVLTYGIMGYPFALAGPVGGVSAHIDDKTGLLMAPEVELFIRWLQIAVHMPVLELSSGPWAYDQKVVNYTQQLLKYRHDVLWPKYFAAAVQEAVDIGTPVARPLWWIAPEDETAQWIDCEFFLSNKLLVAPVLFPKARQRDIYLPEGGWWRDQLRGKIYKGGQWLRSFHVDLYEIATFVRDVPPASS